MFFLYERETGRLFAVIADTDIRRLLGCGPDEPLEHRQLRLDSAVLDGLSRRGVDHGLVCILRAALGDRPETVVCWGRRQDQLAPAA